jgi:hypothetical protein
MRTKDCVPRTDWFGIGLGFVLMLVGGALTLTWVGAIVGIPMVLGAIGLFDNPKTLRGTPCAP